MVANLVAKRPTHGNIRPVVTTDGPTTWLQTAISQTMTHIPTPTQVEQNPHTIQMWPIKTRPIKLWNIIINLRPRHHTRPSQIVILKLFSIIRVWSNRLWEGNKVSLSKLEGNFLSQWEDRNTLEGNKCTAIIIKIVSINSIPVSRLRTNTFTLIHSLSHEMIRMNFDTKLQVNVPSEFLVILIYIRTTTVNYTCTLLSSMNEHSLLCFVWKVLSRLF